MQKEVVALHHQRFSRTKVRRVTVRNCLGIADPVFKQETD